MRKVIAVAIVIMVGAGVYLFTRPPEIRPDVTFWFAFTIGEQKILEEAISNLFKPRYPDITVDAMQIMDLRTRLLAAIPAGKGPDIFTWAHDWTGEFAKAGYIIPIDELVSPELREKFLPVALDAATYDGKLWALPYAAETVALIYNKAMVEEPPRTMDELIAEMRKAREKGIYGIAYPIDPYFVSAWVHAFGGWYFSDETRTVGLNSEGTKRGLRYLFENIKPYMAVDPSSDVQVGIFLEKKAPFLITGPWAIPSIEAAGIEYGVVPLPKIPELDRWPQPFTGVKVIWMSSTVFNKENAFTFMEWFSTDKDHIIERASKARFVPVLKEVLEIEEIKEDPAIAGFAKAIELGRPMPRSPEMMLVWGPFGDALISAWLEPEKTDSFFEEAQKTAESKIEEIYG